VGLGDVADDGVLEGAAVMPVAVEGDAAKRGSGLGQDAVLGAKGLHFCLLEVGVDLDLVDCWDHGGTVEQRGEVLNHEVADPDSAYLPVAEQRLQGPVGPQGRLEVRRQRLVQEQQVDLVDSELAGALLEAVQRLVVAIVADSDLRLQEDLVAVQAGTVHRFSDLALVAVGSGCVNLPVAGRQRRPDPGAEADLAQPLLSLRLG
jgi:hypothetical protein